MKLLDELKDWTVFEDLIAEIFQVNGWEISYKPSKGSDRSRDIICNKIADKNLSKCNLKMLIQCKFTNKAVNERDVGAILEIESSYGVNIYLIAAKDRLTSNLTDLLDRLDKNTQISFRSLIGYEIESLIKKNSDIFQKYFPKGYQEYLNSIESINEYNLTNLYTNIFNKAPSENEIKELMDFKYKYQISKINIYQDIWNDISLNQQVDKLYNRILERKADPVGYFKFGYMLKKGFDLQQIEYFIKQLDEYLFKIKKITFDFKQYPNYKVSFSRFNMEFINWWSYHRR
ncbi:MAG: restriction endonuclease, partial [bacterium]